MKSLSMVIPPENEQILLEVARRDSSQAALDAFNELVLHYQNDIYSLAYRIMGEPAAASDVTQEAFILAYRRLETYKGGNFRSWLMRITSNYCYDELRRIKRRPATSVEELPGADTDDGANLVDPTETPEQVYDQQELQRAIQDCITALNPDQRIVLVMCDVEQMEYATIADSLGINLGTVKSRLSRARAGMRDCLQAVAELLPATFRLKRDDSIV